MACLLTVLSCDASKSVVENLRILGKLRPWLIAIRRWNLLMCGTMAVELGEQNKLGEQALFFVFINCIPFFFVNDT